VKITFLGTGTSQGVPVIGCDCRVCLSSDMHDKRLRSSVMIETKEKVFIIDTGPDFRQQMLTYNVRKIDAVLFTHEHKDHTAGLDDIRAYNYLTQKPVDVYAERRVQTSLKREFNYAFAKIKYPGVPEIKLHTITPSAFEVENVKIVPIRALHHRLPVLGYRFGDFTYITDSNLIPEKEIEKIKGSKYLVLTGLRKQKHLSHFSLSEAVDFINEINPQQGYITHISHQLGISKDIEKDLPENIKLAYDGLVLDIAD
jgi:phosphoribosyl 1,2-cyclic phosphate phosphodiesterase